MSEFIYVFIYVIIKALLTIMYTQLLISEMPEEKRHNTTQNNDVTRHSYDC